MWPRSHGVRPSKEERPLTWEMLAGDLRRLGVEPGDTLFVHSSFKSLGPVDGDAGTAIRALEEALGPDGLLLMPSFNLVEGGNEGRSQAWDLETAPSTVGYITEYFRQMPGTVRSDHYSHSVAARGRNAAAIVAEHRSTEGMQAPWDLKPWGKTYGSRSPMAKAYRDPRGKVLMLGVDYRSSTYCHLVETTYWNRRLQTNPQAEYKWLNREKLGEWWDAAGRLERGLVGKADSRLFRIAEFVDTLLAAVETEAQGWCK